MAASSKRNAPPAISRRCLRSASRAAGGGARADEWLCQRLSWRTSAEGTVRACVPPYDASIPTRVNHIYITGPALPLSHDRALLRRLQGPQISSWVRNTGRAAASAGGAFCRSTAPQRASQRPCGTASALCYSGAYQGFVCVCRMRCASCVGARVVDLSL